MSAQQGGVSRRSFLLSVAGTMVGAYVMPTQGFEALTAEETKETVRELLSPPMKQYTDNGYFLLWTERFEDGAELMYWHPETEDELADAQRFYEGSRGYDRAIDDANLPPVLERDAEELRLISEILDNLDELEPRRVYAKWLSDRGSTYGKYAYLGCELERMENDESDEDDKYDDLDEERADLGEEHAEEWFAPLTALHVRPEIFSTFIPELWTGPVGFIEKLEITRPGILPERAEYLFAAAPLAHEISLDYEKVDFEKIAVLPQMQQVVSLEVLIDTEVGLRALCTSPSLRRLRHLTLTQSPIEEKGGRMLGSSRILPQLETLEVSQTGLGTAGVLALFGSSRPLRLKCLDLGYNGIDDSGVARLGETPGLRHLTELTLKSNPITGTGLHSWKNAKFAETLTELNVESCELGPIAMSVLDSLPLQALDTLNLSSNEIGDTGVKALASSSLLATVEDLNLNATSMSADGLVALAESEEFGSIEELDVSFNSIGPKGFEALATSENFENLTELLAGNTGCGDKGLTALANSTHLSNLTKLDLDHSRITTAGVRALANSETLTELLELNLAGNSIGFEGAKALAGSRSIPDLDKLIVDEDDVGERGAKLLTDRFGEDNVSLRESYE